MGIFNRFGREAAALFAAGKIMSGEVKADEGETKEATHIEKDADFPDFPDKPTAGVEIAPDDVKGVEPDLILKPSTPRKPTASQAETNYDKNVEIITGKASDEKLSSKE